MKNTGVSGKSKRTRLDYSLAFKLQVIDEVEKGNLTYKQAQRKYGIQGRTTVLVWLRKHGRLGWQETTSMKKSTPNKQIKELEKRIKILQQEKEILNRAIDIADDQFGTEIRKKYLPLSEQASKAQGDQKELEASNE
ncbi:transposase [Chitinophaga eiseniae]|uniref:Transposase n=1 Tax=Chitinophaga eiseniae TaxID=634771 RepID=A0A847SRQ3_9BACT|nr:transposase [Chitinophaga eiseniae]NLR83064.1 transposase [Chitinophaga eiseniae]